MMDEVQANESSIRVNELEDILGIPVVPISAAKNEGIEELIDHAIHVARHRESPGRVDFCPASSDEHDSVGAVHRCIHAAVHILDPEAKKKGMPVRFAVTKMVENDRLMKEKLSMLYTPCVVEVATVKREMGGVKAAAGTVVVQCLIAWIVAFIVHGMGIVLGIALEIPCRKGNKKIVIYISRKEHVAGIL